MAQHVYVINDGDTVYTERFQGNTITIKPKEKIKMERHAAVQFLSQMSAPGFIDENEHVDPNRPQEKRLRMQAIDGEAPEVRKAVCNLDGKEFDTDEELQRYLKSVADKNVEMDKNGNIKKKAA
jgi:hypothetical protein